MTLDTLQENVPVIESQLGYVFQDKSHLVLAFVHRSFFNENREVVDAHNERLEFLGDSVLGLIISSYLFEKLPEHPEGQLSHIRSYLIEAATCCRLLQQLGLEGYVLLGKGESMNAGRGRETILADLFEAVIGAIYLDGGWEAAKAFFFQHFESEVAALLDRPVKNWKADFQDYTQKNYQVTPTYRVVKESGPDHDKRFHVEALVEERVFGEGEGGSKKEAEIEAAKAAMEKIEDDG